MQVGIDVVEVVRFESMKNLDAFLLKYFTDYEIEYVNKKANKFESIAGIFACKEAVLKAFQIGIGELPLRSISVRHKGGGAPFIELNEPIIYLLNNVHAHEIDVSISHTSLIATAICVIN